MLKEGSVLKVYKQTDKWVCFQFEDQSSKNRLTVKGNASALLLPGMKVVINGEYVEDPKYGLQIEISSLETKNSATAAFLYKCVKGIGPNLADEIVRTLGENCIEKIKEDNTLLLKVKGIKERKYKTITESLNKAEGMSLYLSIFEFFNNDITVNQADKIKQACNDDPRKWARIKKNPYWLIAHIDGFGFKKVDKLALASGLDKFSIERVGAAIVYTLQQMSQTGGHCYTDLSTLSKEVTELLLNAPPGIATRSVKRFQAAVDEENEDVIDEFIKKDETGELENWKNDYYKLIDVMVDALMKDISEGLVVEEDERIYWIDLYNAEKEAAKIINHLRHSRPVKNIITNHIDDAIEEIEDAEGCEFSDEQKRAVHTSLQNRISIITGGPGRGKTTIIRAIIKAWNDSASVVCLAPTGKAAKRMEEATGHKASTIHRYRNSLRNEDPDEEDDDSVKLPKNKLIIVDETSMIGIKLGRDVLRLSWDCNLVFVGDIDQLASIEPGCFMKDMIRSKKVPVSRLTKGFRNAGSVAINSDFINKGKHLKSFVLDDDTKFVEAYHEDIIKEVIDFYKEKIETCEPKDIGILSPMKIRGFGSVDSINKAFREQINPVTKTNIENGSGFIVNDRVMNVKNVYDKEIWNKSKKKKERGIFNGDSGTVSAIDYEMEMVTVDFDDGWSGEFSYEEMKTNFIMAYAITIHKSQGSEYKHVLVVASSQHAFFLKRNLIYTAFSRAKKTLRIVGDEKAIAIAARNIDDSIRNTLLCQRIIEEEI